VICNYFHFLLGAKCPLSFGILIFIRPRGCIWRVRTATLVSEADRDRSAATRPRQARVCTSRKRFEFKSFIAPPRDQIKCFGAVGFQVSLQLPGLVPACSRSCKMPARDHAKCQPIPDKMPADPGQNAAAYPVVVSLLRDTR
jgi:hypothetical protein